jgi:hypothetical protein
MPLLKEPGRGEEGGETGSRDPVRLHHVLRREKLGSGGWEQLKGNVLEYYVPEASRSMTS